MDLDNIRYNREAIKTQSSPPHLLLKLANCDRESLQTIENNDKTNSIFTKGTVNNTELRITLNSGENIRCIRFGVSIMK